MKLNKPEINIIRFDTDLSLAIGRSGVNTRFFCEGYGGEALDIPPYTHYVGIRFRISLYVDKLVNEVAGFLAETESLVLEHSSPIKDLEALLYFVNDMYEYIKEYLRKNLPAFDLRTLEFPHPLTMSNALLKALIQLGLYS